MSGFYRPPPPKSASKASASTLCQKCLKRGHYSYECKAVAQQRPYVARPSRTQQLLNPKLKPTLLSDTPTDLDRKTGVSDEQLAQLAAERGRKRTRSPSLDHASTRDRKRSRSASTDSVSTISTNRSRSRSRRIDNDDYMTSQAEDQRGAGKRRRSLSLDDSADGADWDKESATRDKDVERNTRRRRSARSPTERGRGRRRRPERDGPDEPMYTPSHSRSQSRGERRRRRTRSPRRRRERRASRSPHRATVHNGRDGERDGPKANGREDGGRDWRERRAEDRPGWNRERSPQRAPPPLRERSLSPFSKRLALTQAMGMGR